MTIVQSLLRWLRAKETSEANFSPDGFCPNCWGRMEYDGNLYDAVKSNAIDINAKTPNVGWIQAYAEKHLAGITLTPVQDGVVCPSCKLQYKKV